MNWHSITARLLLAFVLVALLPLAVFGYLSIAQNQALMLRETEARMARLADKKMLEIRRYLAGRLEQARLLARNTGLRQAMREYPAAFAAHDAARIARLEQRYRPLLASHIEDTDWFYDVFLIAPNGDVVYTHLREADYATNLMHGPYAASALAHAFRETRMTQENSISDFEFYVPSQQNAAFITMPIIAEGQLLGVLAFQLSTAQIYEVVSDATGLGETGETQMAKLIADHKALITVPLKFDSMAAMQRTLDFAHEAGSPMRQALLGKRGSAMGTDYRGHKVVAAWRYLPELRWGMVVKIDAEEALQPVRAQQRLLFWVLGGLLLFAVLAAYVFGRRIVQPLGNLSRTAEEIAQGKLDMRVSEAGLDEISRLGRAFNRMAANLQALYRSLEDKVAERTSALFASNEQLNEEMQERLQSEQELKRSNDELMVYKHFIDSAQNGMCMAEPGGRILYANPYLLHLLGMEQDELVQHRLDDFFSAAGLERLQQHILPSVLRGESWSGELELRNREGRSIATRMDISLLRDSNGEPYAYAALIVDISAQKETERLMQRHQALLEEAQHLGKLGSWELNLVTGELLWSDEIYRIFELDPAQFRPSYENFLNVIHPDDRERVNAAYQTSLQDKLPYDVVHRLLFPDGRIKWVREHCSSEFDNTGKPLRSIGAVQDITEQKLAEDRLRVAATAFETHEAIMITDANASIVRVNKAFETITGYSFEEVRGKNPRILSSGRQSKAFYAAMWQELQTQGTWSGEIWDRRKNGEVYPKELTITAVKNESGQVSEYVAIFSDISLRKQAEEEIRHLAFYDALTRLPNRRLLLDRFHQALSISARTQHYGAVLFLDMDRFKTLNDTLGHAFGDEMLIDVAKRITGCVREVDTVARLGGDEFVVLLEELGMSADEASQRAAQVAEKVRAALAQPYLIKGHEHHSSPSIGVALYRGNENSVEELLKFADMAMYQAKEAGRNAVRFYDPAMQQAVETRAALESDLRTAISQRQLELFYQIQMDEARRPIGAEALIRWRHPERGLVPPGQFIPIAEESSLIIDIGQWVMETACRQLERWQRQEGFQHLILAINVSAQQFRLDDFADRIAALLKRHDMDPSLLKLELTESVVLNDVSTVAAKMHALKALGVRLSLDDFGTGYSSLSYLKTLPLDQLKIDQSFVREVVNAPTDAVMVKTIIAMARNFRLNVLAEGVETEEQLAFLKAHGCMAYQGYLFSKPVPLEEFERLIEAG